METEKIIKSDYSNLLINKKVLIILPTLLVLVISILIAFSSYIYQKERYIKNVQIRVDSYLSEKKKELKYNNEFLISNMKYKKKMNNFEKKNIKPFIIKRLMNRKFNENRSVFIFKFLDKEKKVKVLVDNKRKDYINNVYTLDFFKTENRRFYIKDILKKLELKNGVYHLYLYKDPLTNKSIKKLSYTYYIKEFDWYVETSVLLTELDKFKKEKIKVMEEEFNKHFEKFIVFTFLITTLVLSLLIAYIRYIDRFQNKLYEYNFLLEEIQTSEKIFFYIYDSKDGSYAWRGNCVESIDRQLYDENGFESFFGLVNVQDKKRVLEFQEEVLQNNLESSIEFRLNKSLDNRYVKYSTKKLSKTKILGIFKNITYRKELEILNMKNSLSESNELKNLEVEKVLQMIAHQWRHPLSHINALLINVYDDNFDKDKFVQNIENTTEFLSLIIDDFIDLYSNNRSTKSFSIKEVVESIINLYGLSYLDTKIKVKSFNNDLITNDPSKLKQVIMILIDNSLNIFKKNNILDPFIDIKIKDEGEFVYIYFVDNGGGIDKEHLKRVFELYYTTKENSSSNGLGLYIAKNIINDQFKGEIDIQNYIKGVKTTIKLPKKMENPDV